MATGSTEGLGGSGAEVGVVDEGFGPGGGVGVAGDSGSTGDVPDREDLAVDGPVAASIHDRQCTAFSSATHQAVVPAARSASQDRQRSARRIFNFFTARPPGARAPTARHPLDPVRSRADLRLTVSRHYPPPDVEEFVLSPEVNEVKQQRSARPSRRWESSTMSRLLGAGVVEPGVDLTFRCPVSSVSSEVDGRLRGLGPDIVRRSGTRFLRYFADKKVADLHVHQGHLSLYVRAKALPLVR